MYLYMPYVGGITRSAGSSISNSYSTGYITATAGENKITYIGGIVGKTGGTIINCHWLYHVGGDAEFAVGLSDNYGIPVNFGGTKYTAISAMFALADVLNGSQTETYWENKSDQTPILVVFQKEGN